MRELGSQIADLSVGSQQSLKHKARDCLYGHRLNDVSEVHVHEHVLMMLVSMPIDAVGWPAVRWTGAGHGRWRQRLLPA